MFLRYQLRKPFSRKIRFSAEAIIDGVGRNAFQEKYASILEKDELAGLLALLSDIYAEDFDKAMARHKCLVDRFNLKSIHSLFEQTDIRKFTLALLRNFYASDQKIDRGMAVQLKSLAMSFDPKSNDVFGLHASESSTMVRKKFSYETKISSNLSIGIYFRSKFFPTSRPHDLAYRFKSAFEGVGIRCEIAEPDVNPEYFIDCDIALVDDPHVFRKTPIAKRKFLENVRSHSRKMAMLEMDPWAPGLHSRITDNKDIYDIVWAMMPSLQDEDGCIAGLKASAMLFPVGAPEIFSRHNLKNAQVKADRIKFCGGLEEYNYYRYFWIIGALTNSSPPKIDVTNHSPDSLSVEDSLDIYAARLSSSYACLNFMRRANGESSIVGRTSDALRLSQLLVQENSAEILPYLTPDEHFIEFSNLVELDEICRRLEDDHLQFEEVRRSGADYFNHHYSDAAVVRHMSTWV